MNGRLRFLVAFCAGFLVWVFGSFGLVWAADCNLIAIDNAPYPYDFRPSVTASPAPSPPPTPTPAPEPEDPPASFQPVYTGGGEYTVSDSGTHGLLDSIGDVLVEIKRKVFAGASHIFDGVKWAKQFFENGISWIVDVFEWATDYYNAWLNYAYDRALVFAEQLRSLMRQFSVFAQFLSSLVTQVWEQFVLFVKSFVPWAFWRVTALLLGCVSWILIELVGWLPEMHLTIAVPTFLQWVSVFVPIPVLVLYVGFVVSVATLYLTLGAVLRWVKVFR